MDWEAQDEGVIAKILAPDGSKDIPVGTVVAVVVEDAEHVSSAVHLRCDCRQDSLLACMAQQCVGSAASLVWSVVVQESPSLSWGMQCGAVWGDNCHESGPACHA